MPDERVHYRGQYHYADTSTLERAVTTARAELAEEDLDEAGAWLRFFVARGTSLTVNVTVPASAEHRFAAANVFLILAHGAIDGSVQAVQGTREIDQFFSGSED